MVAVSRSPIRINRQLNLYLSPWKGKNTSHDLSKLIHVRAMCWCEINWTRFPNQYALRTIRKKGLSLFWVLKPILHLYDFQDFIWLHIDIYIHWNMVNKTWLTVLCSPVLRWVIVAAVLLIVVAKAESEENALDNAMSFDVSLTTRTTVLCQYL